MGANLPVETGDQRIPTDSGNTKGVGMIQAYRNFDLRICPDRTNGYLVEVLTSPAGQASGHCHLDTGDRDLQAMIRQFHAFNASAGLLKTLGDWLFRTVFCGDIVRCYEASLGADGERNLRLRLQVDSPKLAALPWELMYDQRRERFLCLSLRTPLVRFPASSAPVRELIVEPPLRLLLVTAEPSDRARLNVESELDRLATALEPLARRGRLQAVVLRRTTASKLRDRLRRDGPFHLLHYICHGEYNAMGGRLVLEDDNGQSCPLGAEELGVLLRDFDVRLAFVNVCWTARGVDTMAPGVAQSLAAVGLPAVVGAQSALPNKTALVFSEAFYTALSEGDPIEAAMVEGRQAVMLAIGLDRGEWAIPVLFNRAPDGLIVGLEQRREQQLWMERSFALRQAAEGEDGDGWRARLRAWSGRVLDLLGEVEIGVRLEVRRTFGSTLELVSPHNTAVVGRPIFRWRLGEEVVAACAEAMKATGAGQPIETQVAVRLEGETVWQTEMQALIWDKVPDPAVEGNRERELVAPDELVTMLDDSTQYEWELVVAYPLWLAGKVSRRRLYRRAVFRVLSEADAALCQEMVAGVGDGPDRALLRGAVYESFGLYDDAILEYEAAMREEATMRQSRLRLGSLYEKRAHGLLGLAGEIRLAQPVPEFAEQANLCRQVLLEG